MYEYVIKSEEIDTKMNGRPRFGSIDDVKGAMDARRIPVEAARQPNTKDGVSPSKMNIAATILTCCQ